MEIGQRGGGGAEIKKWYTRCCRPKISFILVVPILSVGEERPERAKGGRPSKNFFLGDLSSKLAPRPVGGREGRTCVHLRIIFEGQRETRFHFM